MASTYSTNLALDLMANGDQSGTWGTTNNTNLGTLIEQAISGYVTQAITDGSGANTTITIPNGATGVARNMFIEMTGALTFSTTSLIVPANKKMYFIFNNTTGGFAVTVKVSGQTGILVPNGKKVILTSNGTDIVEAANQVVGAFGVGGALTVTGAATIGTTLAVTGTTTAAAINASGSVTLSGTSFFRSITTSNSPGTFNFYLAASGIREGTAGDFNIDTYNGGWGSRLAISQAGVVTIQTLTVGLGGGAVATNTAVGVTALAGNTTGAYNTAIGAATLSVSTGDFNTAVGRASLSVNTSASNNTAVGGNSLANNTTGASNTAIGMQASQANTTGASNVSVGYQALVSNTTASNNTAVGYQAGYSNTTGSIVAVGSSALYSNSTGTNLTAMGGAALQACTVSDNTAFGYAAGYGTTTGNYNAFFGGREATANLATAQSNTTGTYNSAFGHGALAKNTTASYNTAVGYHAGYGNTTGTNSVYLGSGAGKGVVTASDNCMIGYYAGESTTGGGNTFVGGVAGNAVTSGTKNTIIGRYNGNQGGLDIRTSSGYLVLSDGDGNPIFKAQNNASWALQGASVVGGAGISFPATQSASTDANTLDDYEEGTFTAAISTASGTVSTSYTTGYYTKIGNQVSVRGYLYVTGVSSPSGGTNITGLPFTSAGTYVAASIYLVNLTATAVTSVQSYVVLGATTITIIIYNAGLRVEAGPYFQATSEVMYSATYNV